MKLPPYPKYKPSGVEWLGEVPEHWDVKAIKWESPVLRGASPRPIDNDAYFDEEGEYAWVRIADVSAAGMYIHETVQRLSDLGRSLSVPLQPSTLFLSIAGTVGKPCITAIKCCIHDGFVYFPFWCGEARFLYYLFASGEPYRGLGKLGTQLNLNTDTVGSIVAGFPESLEQRAIADFLDRETSRLDALVAKKRALIDRLKEKRTSLISHTVTRGLPPDAARAAGLDPHAKLKPSGIDWLGDVPEHWEVKRLKYSVSINDEVLPETMEPGFEISYVDISSVDLIRGIVAVEDMVFEQAPSRARRVVRDGDTIVSTVRTYLQAIAPVRNPARNTIVSTGFAVVRPRRISSAFLSCVLREPGLIDAIVARSVGVSYPAVNASEIGTLPVPLPAEDEQRAIAAFLDRETAKIDSMVATIETAIERLREYRGALITAAVTGKIDVREAAP